MNRKAKTLGILLGCLALFLMGCGDTFDSNDLNGDDKLQVVCTNFPGYDFARQIAGDVAEIHLLLKPGSESHSFEPSPKDILLIENCDLFIYAGGESDVWVETLLDANDAQMPTRLAMVDCVDLLEEELKDGMQAPEEESSEEDVEMDEHVWTSPVNGMAIVQKISDEMCRLDPDNQDAYQESTQAYLQELKDLDEDFREVVQDADRHEIIVGDRFPFRYFCEEYGLDYYAAFPGCSTDTEANGATMAFLIDKVKDDQIPVVFHIELSNEQICDALCEATGAKSRLFHAVHNISAEDFEQGVTYLDLMKNNLQVLKEALN